MSPAEVYGLLRWTSDMRGGIDEAVAEFEARLEALLEEKK